MTITWKRLGQNAVGANTDTDLYTTPASTTTVAKAFIANRSATATTVRLAVRALGAAIANGHYLVYDTAIQGNQTLEVPGIVLTATDVVTVRDGAGTCTFNLMGEENT